MPQPKATAAIRRVHPPVQITVAKPSRDRAAILCVCRLSIEVLSGTSGLIR